MKFKSPGAVAAQADAIATRKEAASRRRALEGSADFGELMRSNPGVRVAPKGSHAAAFADFLTNSPTVRAELERAHIEAANPRDRHFSTYLRTGGGRFESRDLGEVTGSQGGYLAPPSFADTVLEQIRYSSAIIGHAQIWSSETGSAANYPTITDTAQKMVNVAENTDISASQVDPTFGTVAFGIAKLYSAPSFLRMSRALTQDSAFPIENVAARAITSRLVRGLDFDFTATLLAGITNTVTTAVSGLLDFASLVKAYYTVKAAYRPTGIWIFSTSAMQAIRSLTDTTNLRPLFIDTPVQQDTEPVFGQVANVPLLLGARAYESDNFAAVAGGAVTGIFVSLPHALIVRRALDLEVLQLEERYANSGEIAFSGISRWDSAVALAEAGCTITVKP